MIASVRSNGSETALIAEKEDPGMTNESSSEKLWSQKVVADEEEVDIDRDSFGQTKSTMRGEAESYEL